MFLSASSSSFFQVFNKALDESINGIGITELEECCTSVKNQLEVSNIQKSFINMMVGNSQVKMEEAYHEICRLHDVEALLRRSMKSGEEVAFKNSESSGVSNQLDALIVQEKQHEKERLSVAIQQLDSDVRRTKDLLSRLKAQVQNEITAASEECEKMSLAAIQIGK